MLPMWNGLFVCFIFESSKNLPNFYQMFQNSDFSCKSVISRSKIKFHFKNACVFKSFHFILAEFHGTPVVVECQKELAHIQVNGITINNVEMPKQANLRATNECYDQMKIIDETRKLSPEERAAKGIKVKKTTTCLLTLPGAKVNASDIVRVVYACHDDERGPETFHWTEKAPKLNKDGRPAEKVKIYNSELN